MEKVVRISVEKGNSNMDITAPEPSGRQVLKGQEDLMEVKAFENNSGVSVTVIGCGGAGLNQARPFKEKVNTIFFDTSSTNIRAGEKVKILANGSGSGSNRAENAREIEGSVGKLSDSDVGLADASIVMFSLAGGTGSVSGPLMIRELSRRGSRVIGVAIADTSSSTGAKNTNNTLKTLSAIAKNNDIYLPMIIVSNDNAQTRGEVDKTITTLVTALIGILTRPVYEVDRNDRLNWLNPKKVVDTTPGIKLITFDCEGMQINDEIVFGTGSEEMVDSLLVLQNTPDDILKKPLPLARLKKTGFYVDEFINIVGKVSSDISSVNQIIVQIDKMFDVTKSQKHSTIDRLSVDGDEDLIL